MHSSYKIMLQVSALDSLYQTISADGMLRRFSILYIFSSRLLDSRAFMSAFTVKISNVGTKSCVQQS